MKNKNRKQSFQAKRTDLGNVQATSEGKRIAKFWLKYILLGCIVIITFWCYHNSLKNEFTNWDDERFISQNIFIKSFSRANLNMIFFHDVKVDNYIPLTVISYAVNFHFSGLSPGAYYLTDVIIHILNSCLVFFLVLMLFNTMEKVGYGEIKLKYGLAFFCTLAFAIHPMHVESVSWIAERKDVLYAFFYFGGMITYIHYSGAKRKKYLWLLYTFICFLLSLLSKPMALVFPFSLFLLDVLLKRDKVVSIRTIIVEKLPFIIFSIVCAAITYHLQKSAGAIEETSFYSFFHRSLFASYSFLIYMIKAFIPFHQSAFYPYPVADGPSGFLPLIFYISPLIDILLITVILYFSYRYLFRISLHEGQFRSNDVRIVLFGSGFYFFNMVIISQLISAGPTLMADRYSYVCYFGIFFPSTYFINKIVQRGSIWKWMITGLSTIYLVVFGILCCRQTLVWRNSQTLWTNVIEQYPGKVITAYDNLGIYYFYNQYNYNKAYDNFREAIRLGTNDPKAYCNLGLLMERKKLYDSAWYFYTEAISVDSNFSVAYMDRGIVSAETGKFRLALKDFRQSLSLNPYSETILENIAYTYLKAGEYDSSIMYYNRLIGINPSLYGYFHCRGEAEYYNNSIQPAIEDFKQTMKMAPHDSECMYYLSRSYRRMNDYTDAYKYAQMAQNARYPVSREYMQEIKGYLDKK